MKRITKILFSTFSLIIFIVINLSSCDKMDDIQKVYADKAEKVYLGKVDSISYYPGFGRAKLVWQINADPKIGSTIIYWNNRRDSVVKEFSRSNSGIQKDSLILEDLPEGSSLIEFRNINDRGETSLFSSVTVTAWGSRFAEGLRARVLNSFDYDYGQLEYHLSLTPSAIGDSIVYSEIAYTTKQGSLITTRIDRTEDSIVLADFPDGGTFRFRTIFYPPEGIDTVRSEYLTYKAPTVVSDRGIKIALAGNATSKYFNYSGDLCEWTSNGSLIVYTIETNGSTTEKLRYTGLVSRTAFREFFFYDADRFIGISSGGAVSMYQIINGALSIVKTPTNTDAFGSGFNFNKFVPGKGFFYTIADANGEIKNWFALNNASFGSPNGTIEATGFTHNPFAMFNYQALLGVDASGFLWSMSVSPSGALGSKSRNGSGWKRFTKIVSIGTRLYGLESNGDFYVFNNFNVSDNYWIVN